jgi:hypothetical protein
MKLLAFCFCILGFSFSLFFIWYGGYWGIFKKRILGAYPDIYLVGKKAVQRGFLYLIIGFLFLVGATITSVSLYYKITTH